MTMMTYYDLVDDYRVNPREISTAPINGENPKWFTVYARNDALYVASGREHSNACHISHDRRLKASELPIMLELYTRRKKGEPVAQEAKAQSINQSYWYGIFNDIDL